MRTICTIALSVAALGAVWGCSPSPIARSNEQDLRSSIARSLKREIEQAERYPAARPTTNEPGIDQLGIDPERYEELDRMGGPGAYDLDPGALDLGEDLLGQQQEVVAIGLRHSVRTAVENNLQAQFARLDPAIAESQVVAAEAAFDWVLFANTEFIRTDRPLQERRSGGFPVGVNAQNNDATSIETGVRRSLRSGGALTLQQEFTFTNDRSPSTTLTPDPASQVSLTLQYDQPLLRNFGSDASLAQVNINRNLERNAIEELRLRVITVATDTERAYWDLYGAHRDLLILQKLLDYGVDVRDQVKERQVFDATQSQVADANARVEERRANVLRARTALRISSDRLKQLINDPRFPVGGEVLLIPADRALDEPIEISLLDAILTAHERRPEIQQAILSIDDASIRKQLADNQRLPQLDFRMQAQLNALDVSASQAWADTWEGEFAEFQAGLFYEQPIGNRAAESEARRRRLERMQTLMSYRNTVQQVVTELKGVVRNLRLNFALIPQTTRSRVAASESLRTLIVEEETIAALTVERLDLKLSRQEALAQAERAEVQAIVDYNNTLAEFYRVIGRTLERNRIDFVVPDASETLDERGRFRDR